MLLNITTTHRPATDLGYLLHKHPDRFQSVDISSGRAHIFYPEKGEDKTTVSLLLDIDPIEMVRGVRQSGGFSLAQYVNDRPYVTSSMMSVALIKAFASAMNGHCKDKPELVNVPLPLEASLAVVSSPKGGEALIRRLFEPLGYRVACTRCTLDAQFPEWGESKYYSVKLTNCITVKELLLHLYVLLPALDTNKHYFVNEDEVSKLLQKGEGWLNDHPEKEQIIRRYLVDLRSLTRHALERLDDGGGGAAESAKEDHPLPEKAIRLHDARLAEVVRQLVASGAGQVLDLGCGDGKLIRLLMKEKQFSKITGMDASYNELLKVKDRLRYDEMSPRKKEQLTLLQGSLTYRDKRLEGYDAAAVVEVVEHIDPDRLEAFAQALFGCARPKTVVLTTPNREYNPHYDLPDKAMRHSDHRFEWTRAEFADWVASVGTQYGYRWTISPIGEPDEATGAPCQMAVFVMIHDL
jgi:3' terminal RNA ribose 2'-O-methyltransferase Hen1